MAILSELGTKFPCTTEGAEIPLDDPNLEMYAGDVVEAYFEADRDIQIEDAFKCLEDILKMKEQYPQFVLHYMKVETRRITIQYSVAPEGAHQSPGLVVAIIVVIVAAIVGFLIYAGVTKINRGYVWYRVGWAAITVKDTETEHGISDVRVYADGSYAGTTDGYTVNKKLRTGQHIFTADLIEGYYISYPTTAIVNLNETTPVTVYLRPEGSVEPETGFLDVYTSPPGAEIFIDGGTYSGISPCAFELSKGEHSVGFGDLEGYITPGGVPVTVVPGQRVTLPVVYQAIQEGPWYENVLKYAIIGGAIVIGAVLILPTITRAIRKK